MIDVKKAPKWAWISLLSVTFLLVTIGGIGLLKSFDGFSFRKPSWSFGKSQKYPYYPAAVELQGFDEPSEWIETPKGTTYQFEGPRGTEVLFQDGTRGPITKNFGVKRGIFRFYGPKGEKVVVAYWVTKKA